MYALINNGVVEKYPYSIGQLRKDNPNTSFPKNPTEELLASWGVHPVQSVQSPAVDYTKNVYEGTPVNDGVWKQHWVVSDASPEEISSRIEQKKADVRSERDSRLAATDWRVIKHLELNENIPAVWELYRQALRDVPNQSGFPFEVQWPVSP